MLKECIQVFEHEMDRTKGKLILDTYIPADGTYLIVGTDGEIKVKVNVKKDKKTNTVDRSATGFRDIVFYDYNSVLVSMNKPVDPKKVIHSNNYLSFAVKKESITSGKLTNAIIEGYYHVLTDPAETKYSRSKEARAIYAQFEEAEGKPDAEKIQSIQAWIEDHIFTLSDIDLDQKNYLKIFFEAEKEEYERENRRYLLPNIYNSNEYNLSIEEKIYGLPDNNLGMNAKKPFLMLKTRKNPIPYLLDRDQVLVQKQFFDYLMNLVSCKKYHIYVDTETNRIEGYENGNSPERMNSGYYLRIAKDKNEARIDEQDNIAGYRQELKKAFVFYNYAGGKEDVRYKIYNNRIEISGLINEVIFNKWLNSNYTLDVKDMSIKDEKLKQNILNSRKTIFDWVFKGVDHGMSQVIRKAAFFAAKNSLMNDYRDKALLQINLMLSFQSYFSSKGEDHMGEIISSLRETVKEKVRSAEIRPIESDEEYYFCVGQLAKYLVTLSKAKDISHSLLNPLFNAKSDEMLKQKLLQMYKKFNYRISNKFKRTETLFAMVFGYEPSGKVDQEKILLGFACDNVIFAGKKDKGEENNDDNE